MNGIIIGTKGGRHRAKEVEIHGFSEPAILISRWTLSTSCDRKVNLVKILIEKSMNSEKIEVHVDKYFKSAPMCIIKAEFLTYLQSIQHCGQALFSPTSVNLVYS